MPPIRILIVDDHGIVRAGVASLLDSEPGMEVVGQAADGEAALEQAIALTPDIIILDIEMPGTSGIEATREIRSSCPDTRVLVLSMHDEPAVVRAAIDAGCAGYVVKEAVGTELVAAVQAVYQGRSYFNLPRIDQVLAGPEQPLPGSDAPHALLSARELEVLKLLAAGFTNQEAAQHLSLSDRTVATYRARLGEKLGLRSRADIVRYALSHGLLGGRD